MEGGNDSESNLFNSSDCSDFLDSPRGDNNNVTNQSIDKNRNSSHKKISLNNNNSAAPNDELEKNQANQNILNSKQSKSQLSPNQNDFNSSIISNVQIPNSQIYTTNDDSEKNPTGSGSRLLKNKTISKAQNISISKAQNISISKDPSISSNNSMSPTNVIKPISPNQSPTSPNLNDNLTQSDSSFASFASLSPPIQNQKNSNAVQNEPIVQRFTISKIPSVDDTNQKTSNDTHNPNLPPLNIPNDSVQANLGKDDAKQNSPSHLPPIPNAYEISMQANPIQVGQQTSNTLINTMPKNSQSMPVIVQPQVNQPQTLFLNNQQSNHFNIHNNAQLSTQQSNTQPGNGNQMNNTQTPIPPLFLSQPNSPTYFTQQQQPVNGQMIVTDQNQQNQTLSESQSLQFSPSIQQKPNSPLSPNQPFTTSPQSPTIIHQQYNPSEKVHISFQAAIDQSFTTLRRSIMSELDSILRINRASAQNRNFDSLGTNIHGYSFDVDQFCENLSGELMEIISFANSPNEGILPMNRNENTDGISKGNQISLNSNSKNFFILQSFEREIRASIDKEIRPLISNAKNINEKLQEKKDHNIQDMKNLIQDIESLRLSCKSFGEEIIFQLEKEAMDQETTKDMEIAKHNMQIRKLKDIKLQEVDLNSKMKQLDYEHQRIFEGLRQLKQNRISFNTKSNVRDNYDSFNDINMKKRRNRQSAKLRYNQYLLKEINNIAEEMQNVFGTICSLFEDLKTTLDNDENDMRKDLVETKYAQFNFIQPQMNYFAYQRRNQQYPYIKNDSNLNATFINSQNESLLGSPFKPNTPNRPKQRINGSSSSVLRQNRK